MRSIRTLHTQQRQNRNEAVHSNEVSRGPNNRPPQEHNLIMFTLPLPQDTAGRQGEPKKQRTPRKRKEEVNGSLIKDSLNKMSR